MRLRYFVFSFLLLGGIFFGAGVQGAYAATPFDTNITSPATSIVSQTNPYGVAWGHSDTVAYMQVYIAPYYFSTDRQIIIKLYTSSASPLDCESASGMYANANYGIPLSPTGGSSGVEVTFAVTGTQCAITAGNGDVFYIDTPLGPFTHWTDGYFAGDGVSTWYQAYNAANNPNYVPTNTRIDSYVPVNGATVASTTPVSLAAVGYVNSSSLPYTISGVQQGYRVHWRLTSFAQSLQGATGNVDAQGNSINCGSDVICAFGSNGAYDYYDSQTYSDVAGAFSVATTTGKILPIGEYSMTTSVEIQNNSLLNQFTSFIGFQTFSPSVLVSTTSVFTIATATPLDLIAGVGGQYLANALSGVSATTTSAFINSCNPIGGSFSITDCLFLLFVPTSYDLTSVLNSLYTNVLTVVPWGYVTLLVTDLQSATTTPLTGIVVNTPSTVLGTPFPIQGKHLDLEVFSNLPTASTSLFSLATSTDGLTFRQATEPYWDDLCDLVFAFLVLRLLLGIPSPWGDPTETQSDIVSTEVAPGHRRSDTITRRRRL